MKKKISALLSALIIASAAFAFVSCAGKDSKDTEIGTYTAVTADEFTDAVLNTLRVDAYDITSKAEIDVEKLLSAYDGNTEVQYLEFSDSGKAEAQFGEFKVSLGASEEKNADGYGYFEVSDGDMLYAAVRVENTVVLCCAKDGKTEKIDEILGELGYKK